MTGALRRNILPAIVGLLLLCIVGALIELRLHPLQRFYDELVLDNRNHYLSCQQLPTKYEVERILEKHNETIKQVEQVAPGFVNVEIDDSTCSGKADLLISYGTHQQRIAIESIIQNDTFFGIPYRLQNR
jgi:pantothenate synthetase